MQKLKLKVFKHVWSQVCLEIFGKVILFFCQKHFKFSFEIEKLTRVYETFKIGKVFRLKSFAFVIKMSLISILYCKRGGLYTVK